MNIADIVTELNNHGFTDTADTQKMVVINDTMWDIEAIEPWPFLEKSIAITFDGTNPYPTNMPTDFRQVKFIADTVIGTGIWPERIETVRDRYSDLIASNQQNINPFLYYQWGGKLNFYPIPPSTAPTPTRFIMDYIASQPTLTSADVEASILLPKRHHRVITLGAVYKLYAMEDDLQNAQAFQSMYEDKLTRMREDLMRKQYQRPDVVFMTDADEDYLN